MRVLIIGAGTGGLALAHALQRAGIEISVFERDLVPNADTGGYRVGISPAGSRALKACIAPELYELFVATCARAPRNSACSRSASLNFCASTSRVRRRTRWMVKRTSSERR